MSLKTPVKYLELSVNNDLKDAINSSIKDFKATLFIQELIIKDSSDDFTIDKVELELENQE